MIIVEIGHEAGLDLHEEDGVATYVPVEGQRTTTVRIPSGISPLEAVASVKALLANHIQQGHQPAWIKSSDATLQQMLIDELGLTGRSNRRPANWGQEGN